MGKRSKQFDEEERSVRCRVCDEDIAIDYYMDRGDLVACDECGSEFVIKSRNPVILFLLVSEDDEYDDEYDESDDNYYYDDDYFIDEESLDR